jgi:hypothetical protein
MEDERRKAITQAMNEQMGDIEFQMDIAPNLNYKGPIDPSRARMRQTPKDIRTALQGYNIGTAQEIGGRDGRPPQEIRDYIDKNTTSTPYLNLPNESAELPLEEATVNVVNPRNANNMTYSHEYRHAQGMINERQARLVDAYNAQNSQDWDSVVESKRYALGKIDENGERIPASRKKAQDVLLSDMKKLDKRVSTMGEEQGRWYNKNNNYWKYVNDKSRDDVEDAWEAQ